MRCASVLQLLSHVALDVALCALSELLGDWGSLVEELLRALGRVFKANRFPLMAEMCQLFLPGGKRIARKKRLELDSSIMMFCGFKAPPPPAQVRILWRSINRSCRATKEAWPHLGVWKLLSVTSSCIETGGDVVAA